MSDAPALPETLAEALAERRAAFVAAAPAETQAIMARADAELAAAFAARPGPNAGDVAPGFALPSATGETVSLAAELAEGPAILTFYRGGWCPYCNLEMRAYQRLLPEIEAAGVRLVAISPQAPDGSLSTAEKNGLRFAVLSDAGSAVAKAYGVAFTLSDELAALYAKFGNDLPKINGADDWTLPVPATFVIGRDGRIVLAHVETDYRHRLEPAAALAAARGA